MTFSLLQNTAAAFPGRHGSHLRDLWPDASLRHPERHQQLHAASEEAQVRDVEVLVRRHIQRIQRDGATRQTLSQVS